MQAFESLIRASASAMIALFSPLRGRVRGEGDARRGQIAQMVGLNGAQLVCGVGFNPELARVPDVARFLGYAALDALLAERNYLFIHDRYRGLTVTNVVEIYGALGAGGQSVADCSDLVMSRLNHLESQLEETINPILIGGYKLEVRAIYENRLASPSLVGTRLGRNYQVLRDITGEIAIMLETGAVAGADLLAHDGVTAEEKSRAIFQGLIPATVIDSFLAARPGADADGKLKAARANLR